MSTTNVTNISGESRKVCDYIAAKCQSLYAALVVVAALLAITILGHVSEDRDPWHWVLVAVVGLGWWRQDRAERRAREIYNELEW